MESVINNQYIDSYVRTFSNIVLNSFFKDHDYINGEEILSLTEIRQINLMIIKNLMIAWKNEAEKLRSPYFNYENHEVKATMEELMGALSRNIKIDQAHFKPLLEEAVHDTMLLIFSPYEFYHKELETSGGNIHIESLKNEKKFIKINGGLYEALLEKILSSGKTELTSSETKKYFNQVCEESSFEPEESDQYIDKLSEVEPLFVQKIYQEVEISNKSRAEDKAPSEENVRSTIYEQYLDPKQTLADKLKKESSTLLDIHQKQKIDSIRKNISIQQKFMFLKELFQNNDEEFNQVVNYLDQCNTRDEAIEYLENNYFNPGTWNDENEAVIDFMTVLDKKFV